MELAMLGGVRLGSEAECIDVKSASRIESWWEGADSRGPAGGVLAPSGAQLKASKAVLPGHVKACRGPRVIVGSKGMATALIVAVVCV